MTPEEQQRLKTLVEDVEKLASNREAQINRIAQALREMRAETFSDAAQLIEKRTDLSVSDCAEMLRELSANAKG